MAETLRFNFAEQEAYLVIYAQEIVLAQTEKTSITELLVRGFVSADDQMIPMPQLLEALEQDPKLLLALTLAQVKAAAERIAKQGSSEKYSINLAASILTSDALFNEFWQKSNRQVPHDQQQHIVFEISEAEVSPETIRRRSETLSDSQFLIALDDFGAAHSNLVRLRSLVNDIIKLDLRLLDNVPNDLWATSCYEQTVELCAATGAFIIAEGVETQTQADFMRWIGVDAIQGYYYSIPHPL